MLLDRDRPYKLTPENHSKLEHLLDQLRDFLLNPFVDEEMIQNMRMEATIESALHAYSEHSQDHEIDDRFFGIKVALGRLRPSSVERTRESEALAMSLDKNVAATEEGLLGPPPLASLSK